MRKPVGISRFRRWSQVLLALVLAAQFLVGCRFPWQEAQDAATKQADMPEVEVETESPEIAAPEPRQDLPPALVEASPLPDSLIGLQQPISLYFNQPMDTASVEAAIHFEPKTSGRFSWEADQVMTFVPDRSMTPNSPIKLVLSTSAQAANKETLREQVEINYQTAGLLEWVQAVPADGAVDIDPEGAVFLVFNQAVVALGGEEASEAAFTLSPEAAGEGEWINTSTYLFRPDPSLDGGTTYTLMVNQDLIAASGSSLDPSQDTKLQFTTTQPAVLTVFPQADDFLSLDGPVELQFNIRMNPDSVAEHLFMIDSDGNRVEGKLAWDDQLKTVSFSPNELLERDSLYLLQLTPGAESAGGLPITEMTEWFFTTFPDFNLAAGSPPEFESYYQSYGNYAVYFSTPIDAKDFRESISVSPEISQRSIYLTENNTRLNISGYFIPETQYTVTLGGGFQDTWGAGLEAAPTLTFFTPLAEPSLSPVTGYTSNNLVFVPAFESEIALQATNISQIFLELAPISLADLVTLLHPDNYNYRQIFLPETLEKNIVDLDLVRNTSELIRLPLSYQGEPLTPGVYFLGIGSPDLQDAGSSYEHRLLLIVSANNVVMKVAPEEALIWGTRLEDYSPLSGVPVTLYSIEGEILAEGITDQEGFFEGGHGRADDTYTSYFTLLGQPGGEDFAFSISNWMQFDALYEQDIRLDTLPPETKAYLYTDRPLYRPGDTVHFKAVVYSPTQGAPVASKLDQLNVTVISSSSLSGSTDILYSKDLELSNFGTLADSFSIPENAPPGYYSIELSDGDKVIKYFYFDVAAYRKPDVELTVKLDSEEARAGDTLSAAIQADYYFGLPASDMNFNWTLYEKDAYFTLPGYQVGPIDSGWLMPYFSGYYSPLGVVLDSGEGRTDMDGQADFTFSSELLTFDETAGGSTKQVSLEVTLVEQTGLMVSYRESAMVHPEDFYIGVKPDVYYGRAETPINFAIFTVDWAQQAVGDLSLEAAFEGIEWEVEETNNPEMPYRYVPVTTFIGSASPITDGEGRTRVSFTPPTPGTYRLTVRSGDALTEVLIWVTGSGSAIWPRQIQNQIRLVPDADQYEPGGTAAVFIPNPFPDGARALVSVERGGVISAQILDIEGPGATFTLPITEEAIPNIYFSVILLGKTADGRPDYCQGILNLPVSIASRTLKVSLVVDPSEAEPGDTVAATLTVRDASGSPVQGEFSLAVVDKALLALVKPISASILDALYGEQALSVQTSISLKTYASQHALNPVILGAGGGGGGAEQTNLREDFPDTAFWQADVLTGVDGTARVMIPMPDSLTTWVVDVRGLTEDFLVGQAEAEILTQKDLMIRPVTPRFLVDGDIVEMGAVVHNNTGRALNVDVSLNSTGFSLLDKAQATQQVAVEAGGRASVSWKGVVESVDTAELVFQAVSGTFSDATTPIWGDLQVRQYATPFTQSTAGQLSEEGQRLELVSLPLSSDPSSGTLMLELTPSLSATVIEGLEALETHPYSSTITILSQLLANLHAYSALAEIGADSPQLENNLLRLIDEEIGTLLNSQNIDGGWSWWRSAGDYDSISDPFMTAYVILGLEEASQAGLDVQQVFRDRAVEYLRYQLLEPGDIGTGCGLDQLAFQVYALRDADIYLNSTMQGLYARRSELSPWAVSLLALALNTERGSLEQVRTLLDDLEASALRSATGVHWESDRGSWLLPGTPIFNSAVVVLALAQLDPASTSLAPAVQYLLKHRDAQGLWASPFDSAWSLIALTRALQGTGDYQADFNFSATLNDVPLAEGSVSQAAPQSSVTATAPITDLFPDAPNALEIERGPGAGTLYYRVDLETSMIPSEAESINRGINLQRAYYTAGEGCPGSTACTPIESLTLDTDDPSQMVTVAITLTTAQDMYHVMLEDTIPSGTEILNPNLLTSQTVVEAFDPTSPFEDGWGWWYFNEARIYDDHLLWTAEFLPAGTYTLTYELLPTHRGTFQVLPARAWQYFYPEVQGSCAGAVFTID